MTQQLDTVTHWRMIRLWPFQIFIIVGKYDSRLNTKHEETST